MKQEIRTDAAPKSGGVYSQGIVAGNLVFTAGQVPRDPVTGQIPHGIDAQTRLVLRNVSAILEAAGCSMKDVVKTTVHLANLADWDGFNVAYCDMFPEPRPARTTVRTPLESILVEIDVVAIRPS
ncbi:MAG: Rid family detoxifying hydrolase [Candidatus Limnocylindrales bacterium]